MLHLYFFHFKRKKRCYICCYNSCRLVSGWPFELMKCLPYRERSSEQNVPYGWHTFFLSKTLTSSIERQAADRFCKDTLSSHCIRGAESAGSLPLDSFLHTFFLTKKKHQKYLQNIRDFRYILWSFPNSLKFIRASAGESNFRFHFLRPASECLDLYCQSQVNATMLAN